MTTYPTTEPGNASPSASPSPIRRLVGFLALAASPTFALMAWATAGDMASMMPCGSGASPLSLGGMSEMYLLMSLFHLPPWLKFASGGPRSIG